MTHYRGWEPLLAPSALIHGTALVVAPHPDDEVAGCGGMLIAHREAGQDVHVVVLTDGARGNPTGAGIHAKALAVQVGETRWSVIGSLNGGEVSHKLNREVVSPPDPWRAVHTSQVEVRMVRVL